MSADTRPGDRVRPIDRTVAYTAASNSPTTRVGPGHAATVERVETTGTLTSAFVVFDKWPDRKYVVDVYELEPLEEGVRKTKRNLSEAMGLGQALSRTGQRKTSADMEQQPLPSVRRFKSTEELMQAAADIVSAYWDDTIADEIGNDLIARGIYEPQAEDIINRLGDVSNLRWEAENGKGEVDYDEYQTAYDEVMDDLASALRAASALAD